jgi:hypothetical protein
MYFLIAFILFSNYAYSQFSGGAGTQANPYQISSKADMEALADSVAIGNYWSRNKYFELTNDITDSVRTSVGEISPYSSLRFCFAGNFDGKGHKITLSIIRNVPKHVGCFGYTFYATIQNLVVDGIINASPFVAGVAGISDTGSVIRNCINFCDVTGTANTGGISSKITRSTMENCINLGTINGGSSQTAGITADGQNNTTIQYNLNLGNVYSTDSKTGGINGDRTSDNIRNCINAGFIPNGNSMYGDGATNGLSTSINVGVTQRNIVSSTCFFDLQMFYPSNPSYFTQARGRLTNNSGMCGTALQSVLGDNYWIYEDSLYPRLKNMPMEEPGYVAASPVFLRINSNYDYDNYNAIRYCFKVSNKYGVQWRCKNGRVEINNNTGWVKLLSTGRDTLTAYLVEPKWGKEITKTIPINIIELNNDCEYECKKDTIKPVFKIYNRNRQVKENYKFEIGTGRPRIVFMLTTNENIYKEHNIKEISVSFNLPNVLLQADKSTIKLLDIPSTWKIKDTIITHNSLTKMSHHTITLESSAPLEFKDSIKLFHIDLKISIPISGYVDSILPEHYKVKMSDVDISIKEDDCITIDSINLPSINIKDICAADTKMLLFSPHKFEAELYDNTIQYSIGLDWDATAKIYNILGQEIYTIDSGNIKAGEYEFNIDLLDIPVGIYYFDLNAIGLYRKIIGIVK